MEGEKEYSIYRLFDKHNPDITRYVGITYNPELRFSQHLLCDGANPGKDAWIQTPGVEVGMEVIEVNTGLQKARRREAYWINSYLEAGAPLTNQVIPSLNPRRSNRNPSKYVYVAVALPKANTAVQRMIAYSEKSTIDLRLIVKEAVILAYSDPE